MELFDRIPEDFFRVLTSSKRDLYAAAILVLRQAFKTELIIRKTDLIAMLIESLESRILMADFLEESDELGENSEYGNGLSGKASLLVRVLKKRGWITIEYEPGTFIENVSVPDYAIATADLIYNLSEERVSEYNGYVYATYASLKSCDENPEYRFQALSAAYTNSTQLITELKTLYNNIGRYYQRILDESDVNKLLWEHFDNYREQLFDAIYYPLKTIDSVPRFRHPILSIVHSWEADDEIIETITEQGVRRKVFSDPSAGRERTLEMLIEISETYEKIENLIRQIDNKHNEYTRASIEKIRYALNVDRSIKGKLVQLLKVSNEDVISDAMRTSLNLFSHSYIDHQSAYNRIKRTVKSEGRSIAIEEHEENPDVMAGFLNDIRKQYSNKKIDAYVHSLLGESGCIQTADITVKDSNDFILFLLTTIRGREKGADYSITFGSGYTDCCGYRLPDITITRKEKQ